jgi:serine protease Do
MGFPPISGFDAMLVSDITHVNAFLKSSSGKIVAQDESYLDKEILYLFNARVKGGNSGSPLINKYGLVVGIVLQLAHDLQNPNELDKLGYGMALPAKSIWAIYQDSKNEELVNSVNVPFKNTNNYIELI